MGSINPAPTPRAKRCGENPQAAGALKIKGSQGRSRAQKLPSFPWDELAPFKELAASNPQGLIDLSMGSPVDPPTAMVQAALSAGGAKGGYPLTAGSATLKAAIARWGSARGITLSANQILPSIGSKEAVAMLPWQLGFGPNEKILYPDCAYPTYAVSAALCGAQARAVGPDPQTWDPDADLVWVNYPANPSGRLADLGLLRAIVQWSRDHNCLVVADECYAAITWTEDFSCAPSLLADEVTGGSLQGLLLLMSLSKQNNFAGYRGAFICGDEILIQELLTVRKHSGMIVPNPVQNAMVAALGDDAGVQQQRDLYRKRQQVLAQACTQAGLVIHPDCQAGLYLWVSARSGLDAWEITRALAQRGILVVPGTFYGENAECARHVRIALSATDQQVMQAAQRISEIHF